MELSAVPPTILAVAGLLVGCTGAAQALAPLCADVPAASVSDATHGDAQAAADMVYGVERYAGRIAHDEYGGLWLDGGTLVAAFTDRVDEHEAVLRGDLAHPDRLAVVEVAHPMHALEATAGRVGAVPSDTLGGAAILDWDVDAPRNRVAVHLDQVNDQARSSLAAQLDADRVCVSAADGP